MRPLVPVVLLALTACRESPLEWTPEQAPPPVAVVAIACRVDVSDAHARCNSGPVGTGPSLGMATAAALASAPALPGPMEPGFNIDLGGQGSTVGVSLLDVGVSGDSLLVMTAELTNRLDQPLGMVSPIGIDVNAVRLGVVDGPVALGGGTVSVVDPDGLAFFTAADQPFARFEAPIPPNQRAWRDLRFRMTGTVSSFTFRAIVRAALPDESPSRASGLPVRFAAVELSWSTGGCALTAQTQMSYCWGDNIFGEVGDGRGGIAVPGPVGYGRFTRLTSTRTGGMCGTRVDGRIFCWGLLPPYVAGEPTGTSEPQRAFPGVAAREVAIGLSFGCALDVRGQAWCAGANTSGQAGNGEVAPVAFLGRVAGGLTFRSLAVGDEFACGISQARAVFCWGINLLGQVGDGSLGARSIPTRVASITDSVVQVVAASRSACALTQTSDVWCWGDPSFGAVGAGVLGGPPQPRPVRIITGGISQLAAGNDHVCARRSDGTIACWGANGLGQTGTGAGDDVPIPTTILGSGIAADTLVAGGDVTCYRQGTQWTCFGANSQGEAGVVPAGFFPTPTTAGGLQGLTNVSLGFNGGCGLAATGDLWCWGRGGGAQFPDVQRTVATVPTGVFGGRVFSEVDAGNFWACGRRPAGGVYCWGTPHPQDAVRNTPDTLFASVPFTRISVGGVHACGLSETDGTAWCWGRNDNGELGVAGPGSATPVQVTGGQRFVEIRAGLFFTCARDPDGFAWCWGRNEFGQLGRGTSGLAANPVPQRVSFSIQFTSLTAGPATVCGITAANEAVCWGSNSGDVLGIGPGIPFITVPTLSIGTLQVRQLSIGGFAGTGPYFGCGISLSGEVYCGGTGPLGTLAVESGTFRRVPMPVPAVSVSAGNLGACALDANGRLWCWGFVGLGASVPTPTLVTLR